MKRNPAKWINSKKPERNKWVIDKKKFIKKKTKTPKAIGRKKSKRIASGWSEKVMFAEIWAEREHKCCICFHPILEPSSYVFAHILAKGLYPEYRLLKNNIWLVCTMECHHYLDKRINKIWKRIVEAKIKKWEPTIDWIL